MQVNKLENFKNGWIAGSFFPSLLKTDCEIGIKRYSKAESNPPHYHKLADEINVVIDGVAEFIVNSQSIICKGGDIITVEKMEVSEFKAIEECTLLVIKTKSIAGDKYATDNCT